MTEPRVDRLWSEDWVRALYADHVRKRSRNAPAWLSRGYSVTEYEMGCGGQLVWRSLLPVLYDFFGGMAFVCCRDLLNLIRSRYVDAFVIVMNLNRCLGDVVC